MKHPKESFTKVKSYRPFHSAFDPCPPIGKRYYRTPPNLYLGFQPRAFRSFPRWRRRKKGRFGPYFTIIMKIRMKMGGKEGDELFTARLL